MFRYALSLFILLSLGSGCLNIGAIGLVPRDTGVATTTPSPTPTLDPARLIGGWTSVSGSLAPDDSLSYPTTIWTGSRVIVFGGANFFGTAANTGAAYNPSTNTWTAIAPSALAGRGYHTAVWTGTKMLVWGGYDPNSATLFRDGAIYDPAQNSWTMMAPPPVGLIARYRHSAIWTGTKMIVYGGEDAATNALANGGVYDPNTNLWTFIDGTTAPNAPTKRSLQTAAWTGTRMIIWGGIDLATALSDGALYNPASGTWAPMNSGTIERSEQASVWTGSLLLVFGGSSNSGALSDTDLTAAYNPLTDTWSYLSSAGAPSTRGGASAVWTGSQMIVWGGYSGSNYYKDGARYNPTTDTWSAIGLASPAERAFHNAVWTDKINAMFLWGENPIPNSEKMLVF